MKLGKRDQRALLILAGAVVVILVLHFWMSGKEQVEAARTVESIPLAEKRLEKLRKLGATLPAKEKGSQAVLAALERREKGMIQAETAPQAQAQILQIFRRIATAQTPPIDLKTVEMGQVRPLGQDYGEISVPVTFECRIEQLVNLLADLTAQPEALATRDLRISVANAKEKVMNVRLTVSGLAPRRLVPEQKGAGSF